MLLVKWVGHLAVNPPHCELSIVIVSSLLGGYVKTSKV